MTLFPGHVGGKKQPGIDCCAYTTKTWESVYIGMGTKGAPGYSLVMTVRTYEWDVFVE